MIKLITGEVSFTVIEVDSTENQRYQCKQFKLRLQLSDGDTIAYANATIPIVETMDWLLDSFVVSVQSSNPQQWVGKQGKCIIENPEFTNDEGEVIQYNRVKKYLPKGE